MIVDMPSANPACVSFLAVFARGFLAFAYPLAWVCASGGGNWALGSGNGLLALLKH
jgi:hypothetical protein